jgi:hypothetical protein
MEKKEAQHIQKSSQYTAQQHNVQEYQWPTD